MNLNEVAKLNWCKPVRVVMMDGSTLDGNLVGYTSALDNEPEPESITIEDATGMLVELGADEVVSVTSLPKGER